jgi:hypothetical protein
MSVSVSSLERGGGGKNNNNGFNTVYAEEIEKAKQ